MKALSTDILQRASVLQIKWLPSPPYKVQTLRKMCKGKSTKQGKTLNPCKSPISSLAGFFFDRITLDECVSINIARKVQCYIPGAHNQEKKGKKYENHTDGINTCRTQLFGLKHRLRHTTCLHETTLSVRIGTSIRTSKETPLWMDRNLNTNRNHAAG